MFVCNILYTYMNIIEYRSNWTFIIVIVVYFLYVCVRACVSSRHHKQVYICYLLRIWIYQHKRQSRITKYTFATLHVVGILTTHMMWFNWLTSVTLFNIQLVGANRAYLCNFGQPICEGMQKIAYLKYHNDNVQSNDMSTTSKWY